jgi:phosphomannomutase
MSGAPAKSESANPVSAASQSTDPWKPCDLRGFFPAPVSEDLFRRVGAAIGSELAVGQNVVVGGDFRLSTPALKAALIEGLASTGICIVDVGQAPTPIVYFAAQRMEAAAVFIVTASHNPGTQNGLKWAIRGYPPSPADIARIRARVASGERHRAGAALADSGNSTRPAAPGSVVPRVSEEFQAASGAVEKADPIPAYRAWMLSRWRDLPARTFGRIVLDAGNGAWSVLAPEIFCELGFEVECLYCEPDGRFPNRPPDCARTKNLGALRAAVIAGNARLGIAWDGDGDRTAFIDETGTHVSPDEISILFLRNVLIDAPPREHVVCDIKLSHAVHRAVLAAGGRPFPERSGHAFIRRRLLEFGALLGLDACGHYFFREAGWRDDGLYSALFLIGILGSAGSLAEARRSVGGLFSTPELRLPISILSYSAILDRLRLAFPDARESRVDGLRLMVQDGVILARESTTEPVVSLRIEGFSSAGYEKLVDICLSSLSEGDALLRTQIAEAGQ